MTPPDCIPTNPNATPAARVVIERTYDATPDEIWALWTTKEGFESWWGPEGFRVEVHAIDARPGGALSYDMIAATPETVAAMQRLGQSPSHATRGTFFEVQHHARLAIKHVIDFAGVPPFENTIVVQLFAVAGGVRMVVTLEPMDTPELSKMQEMGFTSQLTKLDRRFRPARG